MRKDLLKFLKKVQDGNGRKSQCLQGSTNPCTVAPNRVEMQRQNPDGCGTLGLSLWHCLQRYQALVIQGFCRRFISIAFQIWYSIGFLGSAADNPIANTTVA